MSQKDITLKDKSLSSKLANDLDGYSFVCKKLEKLAAAVYKVTDFVPDNEPIKWNLRKRSSELMFDVSVNEHKGVPGRSRALNKTVGEISGIISLCEIAKEANVVSHMNFTILRDEFTSLRDSVLEGESSVKVQETFEKDRLLKKTKQDSVLDKGQEKDIKDIENVSNVPEVSETKDKVALLRSKLVKAKPVSGSAYSEVDSSNKKPSGTFNKSSARRQNILDFVRENDGASIKDIAEVIIGCGEKTVQRELAKLVDEGVLRRTGERRWSRYSLA